MSRKHACYHPNAFAFGNYMGNETWAGNDLHIRVWEIKVPNSMVICLMPRSCYAQLYSDVPLKAIFSSSHYLRRRKRTLEVFIKAQETLPTGGLPFKGIFPHRDLFFPFEPFKIRSLGPPPQFNEI